MTTASVLSVNSKPQTGGKAEVKEFLSITLVKHSWTYATNYYYGYIGT